MLPVHRFAALVATLLLPTTVSAHGHMSSPSIEFEDINNYYNQNQPAAKVAGTPGPYTGSYVLRDLAQEHGSTCGYTNANAAAQAIPSDGKAKFEISAKHIGPCEIWLDDTKLVYVDDCWTKYPSYEIPVDFSSCTSGSCQLRWVWLATHNDPWEIYDNCANVAGSGSPASSGSNSTDTSNAPSPTTTTAAPTPASSTESSGSDVDNENDETPVTTLPSTPTSETSSDVGDEADSASGSDDDTETDSGSEDDTEATSGSEDETGAEADPTTTAPAPTTSAPTTSAPAATSSPPEGCKVRRRSRSRV